MGFIGKYARLSPAEQTLRLALLDYGLAHPGPIPAQVSRALAGSASDAPEALLDSLDARHYMRREGGDIHYLYPLSCADRTDYHVTLADGRSLFAMCAIDAMGCAVTFHQPVEVRAHLRDTGEALMLRLDPASGITQAAPDDHILATYYDTTTHYIDFNC